MTRRAACALLAATVTPVRADSSAEAWDVIAAMAAALAEDNTPAFLRRLDPKMPGYDELAANVQAMVEQADIHSSISALNDEGGDTGRTLTLNWELRLTRKGEEPRMQVREKAVTIRLTRIKEKWNVVFIEPLAFFAPPDFR